MLNKETPAGSVLKVQAEGYISFFCPGCQLPHTIRVDPDDIKNQTNYYWSWNGDYFQPVFNPSVLSYGSQDMPSLSGIPRCHSYIERGMIRFLADCGHKLANQTVPLPPYPKELP